MFLWVATRLTSEVEPLRGGGRRHLDEVRVLEVPAPREVVHHRHLPRRRPLPLRAPRPPPSVLHLFPPLLTPHPRRRQLCSVKPAETDDACKCKIAESIRRKKKDRSGGGEHPSIHPRKVGLLGAVPSIRWHKIQDQGQNWPDGCLQIPVTSQRVKKERRRAHGYASSRAGLPLRDGPKLWEKLPGARLQNLHFFSNHMRTER